MDVNLLVILLLLPLLLIPVVDGGDCKAVFHNAPTFKNCTYRCHCKNDVQCNEATGDCDNGCKLGWMGPGCQYRNIAPNYKKVANMGPATDVSDGGQQAVDGDVKTCSKTNIKKWNGPQYWRTQLINEYRIAGLVVKIHSDDVGNFNKFRVETGSGPNNADFNSVCYTHGDTPGTTEMEIMCTKPVWTKHLRIIHHAANVTMRLCEVEIYGGRDVTFNKVTNQSSTMSNRSSWLSVDGQAHVSGVEAKDTCSSTEKQINPYWMVDFRTLYVVRSVYFYGGLPPLHPEYKQFKIFLLNESSFETEIYSDKGLRANEYQPMVIEPANQVSARYLKIFRPVTFNVLAICEVIAFGECPFNKCGWDCEIDCYCAAEVTGKYQIDGFCPNGCSGRWTGKDQKCNILCSADRYGENCIEHCGHCNGSSACNVSTGICEDGCSPGYLTSFCNATCEFGSYGVNCVEKCGHCKNGTTCDATNGECGEGCEPGWKHKICHNACENGTHGENCSSVCGNCSGGRICNHRTGFCTNGCASGYKGERCDQDCIPGEFGANCSQRCGHCNQPEECDKTSGLCHDKCLPGWEGVYCNSSCPGGYYGLKCNYSCGHCRFDELCNHTNGACTSCEIGYHGDTCNEKQKDQTSQAVTITGAIVTVLVAFGVVEFVFVI